MTTIFVWHNHVYVLIFVHFNSLLTQFFVWKENNAHNTVHYSSNV